MYEKLKGWQKNGTKRNVFDLHIEALAQTMIGFLRERKYNLLKTEPSTARARFFTRMRLNAYGTTF